jgi:Protein of Unknown function (DUF2784)
MGYGLLADVIVGVHLAYVSYVFFGQLAIFAGLVFRWRWIRNAWFRITHLAMITIVAVEAIFSYKCPLTTWESQLRRLAGQQTHEGTFVGRLLHDLMFFQAPPWVFTAGYITFAVLVVATFILAPPRWHKKPAVAAKA